MSGRVKRTPLFGADGLLGMQVLGNNNNKNNNDIMQILKMENPQNSGLYRTNNTSKLSHTENGKKSPPSTPSKAVNFSTNPENEKHREKYLTAKYGAHQMALIRKRLKVEMWMFDELQHLQDSENESTKEIDIDLDEILDMDDEIQRKIFLRKVLSDSSSSKEIINKFVDDLLERAKTL